ncbi:branched-chain amino acid ABC transporter permease [Ornithinimicrobium sp. W1665]|uniref:branched-chain amino acid ABC transporter permease n=1 Tax=Ornithinimicrobium sp. W1665 TaxID=3416666 RepID=UPI003CEB2748
MNRWSTLRLRAAAVTFAALAVLMLVVGVVGETMLGRSDQRVVVEFLLTAGMVIAIQCFVGNSGIISFGHVAFFGLAAYGTALAAIPADVKTDALPALPDSLASLELGLIGAVGVGVLVVTVFAVATGAPFSRMDVSVVPMATLAWLVVIHAVINRWNGLTGGPTGISRVPDLVGVPQALVTVLFITAVALLYGASPWGLRLQAVREDPVAAASLGIPVALTRFIGWMVSAVLMAVGGGMWALNALAFSPAQFFFAETFALLAMLVIGGLGSVTGAVAGAAAITVLSQLLRDLENGLSIGTLSLPALPGIIQLATAVLILGVLIWRPGGAFGNREIGDLLPRGGRVK